MPFRLKARQLFPSLGKPAFAFAETGPLVDDDLELVRPTRIWVDAILRACNDPLTLAHAPSFHNTSRQQLLDFLDACPNGHQRGDRSIGIVPTYHFWMKTNNPNQPIAGGIGLRVGDTFELAMYYGHFGYHVYPASRGHHYAERACRLLLPLAAHHNIKPLWITCNPDNLASRRTCERLGGQLVEIIPVPTDNALYQRGEKEKCRYRIDV
jgi:tagatose 1,6-diphosphate aldolase